LLGMTNIEPIKSKGKSKEAVEGGQRILKKKKKKKMTLCYQQFQW